MTLQVDPSILREFNENVQTASADIAAAKTGTKVTTAADGLDGSTTQWACQIVGEHVATLERAIATNVGDLGTAVRGAGDAFEVTDAEFADKLDGLFH